MNWLAHIFVSENHVDYQLGNYLADPFKGKSWEGASKNVKDGMIMHKIIDSFTDSHDAVLKSKLRLGSKGILKSIIIDITYDHLLINHWQQYCKICISEFIDKFYKKAIVAADNYPEKAKSLVMRLIISKILTSYGTLEGLGAALKRIDKRLSPKILAKESALNYMPNVKRVMPEVEKDFLIFFPDLIQHFKSNSNCSNHHEWLK
jgi:acyl carrier protein phosphodiesterase